jgi:hypothetical protein
LILAFVLGATLQAYLAANQQTVNEADTLVALDNLSYRLAPSDGTILRDGLACYANVVVNQEFPALKAGEAVPTDERHLIRLYRDLPALDEATPAEIATVQGVEQQLSILTSERGARIRAAHSSLPVLLWVLVIGGGIIVVLSVAAITYVDRPWPQFFVMTGVTAILVAGILLIGALERPYQSSGLRIDAGAMQAALERVSVGVHPPYC